MIIRFIFLLLICPCLSWAQAKINIPDTTQDRFNGFVTGTWEAKKKRESSRDLHVCLQQSYTFKIDSTGKIFKLLSGDGHHFEPYGGIRAIDSSHVFMQLDGMRYKYKIIIPSEDNFRLSYFYGRKEKYPQEQRPISDPIDKKTYKSCDTEIWFFTRKKND